MDSDFFDDDFDEALDDAEVPDEIRQAFKRDMQAFEQAEPTAPLDALRSSGLDLPPSDQLSDSDLHAHLWHGLRGLAFLGIFLHHTDHLSDRELYEHLVQDALRQPVVMMPDNPNFGYHLDLVDGENEEHEQLYLRYYADDEARGNWAEQFPATEVPAAENLPFDRDRLLPRHFPDASLENEAS